MRPAECSSSIVCFLVAWIALFGFASITTRALESTISPSNSFAYSANAGWVDFRPSAEDGVRLDETFLSGYAYSANLGWIHFGDGSPANGHSYSNTAPDDYGVNLGADGALSGFAYSPNIGWIAFENQMGQPRLDFTTGKLSGYAHAANTGWISLDTPSSDLIASSIAPPADSDGDGIADSWEHQHFGNLTSASSSSDADGDGATDLREYLAATEPQDSGSHLRIVSHSFNATSSSANLTFTSSANRRYLVEYDGDLQGAWTDAGFGLLTPDSGATTTRSFVHPASTKLFFRVQARKPLQN